MITLDSSERGRIPGVVWFLAAAAASIGGSVLGRWAGPHNAGNPETYRVLGLAALGAIALAAVAVWRMVRARADAWLLPLAAMNLAMLEPGRSGNPATWRTEWGVGGLVTAGVAALLFARLLVRTDELQRRVYLDGAATALLLALPLATGYALFEQMLPPLRAHWVTMALLLLWWAGWLRAARRYR